MRVVLKHLLDGPNARQVRQHIVEPGVGVWVFFRLLFWQRGAAVIEYSGLNWQGQIFRKNTVAVGKDLASRKGNLVTLWNE